MRDFPRPPDQEFVDAVQRLLDYYTPQDLAYQLGVAESTVSRWRNGRVQPNGRDRERVLDLLRQTIKEVAIKALHCSIRLVKALNPDCATAMAAILDQLEGGPTALVDPVLEVALCELILKHSPKKGE